MKNNITRTFIILFLLLVFNQKSFSQNRIILSNGDTLKCTIKKVTGKYVYYNQFFNGISAKGKVRKDNIKELAYFNEQEIDPVAFSPSGELINETEFPAGSDPINPKQRWLRMSFNGGAAYLLGNSEKAEQALQEKGVSAEDSKNYYSSLKLGYQGKSSIYFLLAGDYWLGAQYHGFYTSSGVTTPMQLDESYMYFGNMSERFFVNFAGPSLFSVTRYGSAKKFGVNSSFTAGPAFYRNEAEMLNEQVLIQGKSLATNLTLGMEYFIQPKISISLETSVFSAKLKKITVKTAETTREVELEKESYENLSRLDLSLGFIFYW